MKIPSDPVEYAEAMAQAGVAVVVIVFDTVLFGLSMRFRKEFILRSRGIAFIKVAYVGLLSLMVGCMLEPFTRGVTNTAAIEQDHFKWENVIVYLLKGWGVNSCYAGVAARVAFINHIFMLKPFSYFKRFAILITPWIVTRPIFVLSEAGIVSKTIYSVSFVVIFVYYVVMTGVYIWKNYQIHRKQLVEGAFSSIRHFSDYSQCTRQYLIVNISTVIWYGVSFVSDIHWIVYSTQFINHLWGLTFLADYVGMPLYAILSNDQNRLNEYDRFRKKQLKKAMIVDQRSVHYFKDKTNRDPDDGEGETLEAAELGESRMASHTDATDTGTAADDSTARTRMDTLGRALSRHSSMGGRSKSIRVQNQIQKSASDQNGFDLDDLGGDSDDSDSHSDEIQMEDVKL